jgi:hypothetical protein
LCGIKGYRLSKLKVGCSLCSYPSIGTELVIRAARSRWNLRQVPVATRERKGRSRFGAGFYANWLIFRAMLLGLVLARAYASKKKVVEKGLAGDPTGCFFKVPDTDRSTPLLRIARCG